MSPYSKHWLRSRYGGFGIGRGVFVCTSGGRFWHRFRLVGSHELNELPANRSGRHSPVPQPN